jgi:hypothetical protein
MTLDLITAKFPPHHGPTLLAAARRAIWNTQARREVLGRVLKAESDVEVRVGDTMELVKLMETSEAPDAADLLARIPAWEEVLRAQIAGANQPKTFFNDQVRYMHGGGRDQRSAGGAALAPKQAELEFLDRLRTYLV